MKKQSAEDRLHKTIVKNAPAWLNEGVIMFHVPNGEKREPRTGARLKAMGVLPGVADLVFISGNGRAHFMELKGPKGNQTDVQKEFEARCEAIAAPYVVIRSVEEALLWLRVWGLLKINIRVSA